MSRPLTFVTLTQAVAAHLRRMIHRRLRNVPPTVGPTVGLGISMATVRFMGRRTPGLATAAPVNESGSIEARTRRQASSSAG